MHLLCITDGGNTNQLTNTIMYLLLRQGGLNRETTTSEVVGFGADDISMFQGPKNDVTAQIWETWALFVVAASCASHHINLVVETHSNYPMISRSEGLFQFVYAYFCRSYKLHSELQKLEHLMETKAKKIVRNVDTCWILMRNPLQKNHE